MSRAQHAKGFHVVNRAWYASPGQRPEILIGLYHPAGGTSGEFAVRWHDLGGRHDNTPRLEIYDDAWAVFFAMTELAGLAELAGKRLTQDVLIAFLLDRGFRDLTRYIEPAPQPPPDPVYQELARIAKNCLGFDTLDSQGFDRQDFREVSVWSVADALQAAWHAGRKARP